MSGILKSFRADFSLAPPPFYIYLENSKNTILIKITTVLFCDKNNPLFVG